MTHDSPSLHITETNKRLFLSTHQGRIKSISILSATPNVARGSFQAGSTDSFSRAHFMVGKPLQTTDSIHVCNRLITALLSDH